MSAMKLDELALEAAIVAVESMGCVHFGAEIEAAIRAYLTSATPPDVARLIAELEAFATGCRGSMWQSRDETIRLCEQAATALRLSAGGGASHAARDVLEERRRQVEVEDFDASHDDMATKGQLAGAAASYAMHDIEHWAGKEAARTIWPWDKAWWKPANRRRNLVKAGALILAEIERLDRLPAPPPPP